MLEDPRVNFAISQRGRQRGINHLGLQVENDAELKEKLTHLPHDHSKIHIIAHTRIPLAPDLPRVSIIPHDPEAFARALYAELHRADETGAAVIIIEQLPNHPAWDAISDRVHRAASE